MRAEPQEEAMYKRMDRKEELFMLLPIWGLIASFGVMLIVDESMRLIGMTVSGIMILCLAGTAMAYQWVSRQIMPMSGCFLEIQGEYFRAAQPFRDGKYETCMIYFEEIIEIVRKKKGGMYIRIDTGEKSIIERETGGDIMYVSPFGYSKEVMQEVYQKIIERLPEHAEVYEYEESKQRDS